MVGKSCTTKRMIAINNGINHLSVQDFPTIHSRIVDCWMTNPVYHRHFGQARILKNLPWFSWFSIVMLGIPNPSQPGNLTFQYISSVIFVEPWASLSGYNVDPTRPPGDRQVPRWGLRMFLRLYVPGHHAARSLLASRGVGGRRSRCC